ncbi:MAG: carboxyl-terminal protease [Acidobacteria bacterium]|nr:carboxyl-terminal protease [Acidobacteriota bacterium]
MNSRLKFFVVFFSTSLVALLLVGAVIGKSAPADEPYKHLAVFTEVVSRIKSEYVEEPDMKSVTLGALNGLLESIDPFASYLNAEQFKEWTKKKDSYKGDVGLLLSKRAGYIGIVGAVPGSPGAQAGLGVGDWIETIKGVATRDMPLAFAELMLRGETGSTIEISVLRARRPEPQKMTLTRAALIYPPVQFRMMDNQVGYIRPDTLATGKVAEAAAAIDKLQGQGAKRWLLDLRNCSTGAPEEGVELANLFVDKGLLGYLQGQKIPRQNFEAAPAKARTKLPMQVVINRGTANGCEVAGAALLDTKRADLVGERTYGAASLRRAVTMEDGAAVILSVAKYYAPGGKAIPDNGVTPQTSLPEPDEQVEYDEDGNPLPPDTTKPKDPGSYIGRILTLIKPEAK